MIRPQVGWAILPGGARALILLAQKVPGGLVSGVLHARSVLDQVHPDGFVLLDQLGQLLVRELRLAEERGEGLILFCTKYKLQLLKLLYDC